MKLYKTVNFYYGDKWSEFEDCTIANSPEEAGYLIFSSFKNKKFVDGNERSACFEIDEDIFAFIEEPKNGDLLILSGDDIDRINELLK